MSNLSYEAGHVIGSRYRLESKLGEGGMGAVWRAQHLTLKSPVAIKFINPSIASSEQVLQRFMREAQSSAALRSTHIVQVFDFGVDGGVPYIAMELLSGESLADRLSREGVLAPAAFGVILDHAAKAMTHAHQAGIVHRDLKPDNIFIVREGESELTKILDFGVAKVTGGGLETTTGGGTKTGAILGTPFYVSPEQARGNRHVDHRSDLWALGVIAYQCVVGTLPFSSDGLGDLLMQICSDPHAPPSSRRAAPAGFDVWMARALHKDPEQRFQSAREMAEAYQALLTQPGAEFGVTVSALVEHPRMPSTMSQGLSVSTPAEGHPTRRRTKSFLALGFAALLGVGGLVWAGSSLAPMARTAASAVPSGPSVAIHEPGVPASAREREPAAPTESNPSEPEPEPEVVPSQAPPPAATAPPAPRPTSVAKRRASPRRDNPPKPKPSSSPAQPAPTPAKAPSVAEPSGAQLFEDRR